MKYFICQSPVGQGIYRVENGIAAELLAGYTDLHHTCGWYHDGWLGKPAKEELHLSQYGDTWCALTDIDPTVVNKVYGDSDKMVKIFEELKGRIPYGCISEDDALDRLYLYFTQWHSVIILNRGGHTKIYEDIIKHSNIMEKIIPYMQSRFTRYSKHCNSRKDYYKAKCELYLVKKWFNNPTLYNLPRLWVL